MNKKIIISAIASIAFLAGCGCSTQNQKTTPQSPIVTLPAQEDINPGIPEGCITWFDGCNTCNVGESGTPMACTKMACEQMQEPYCAKYDDENSESPVGAVPVSEEIKDELKNATYKIETEEVTLIDGESKTEVAPGSATKIITQTTQFMAEGDLQQGTDATLDGAVVLTQDPGGSGTFYYVGGVLQQPDKTYKTISGTYFLGDRIEIKEIEIDGRKIYVTYLDREDDDAMSASPTKEVIREFATNGDVLMDVTPTQPTQESEGQMMGNDKDEHGCIGSAGYSWNEQAQKCERPWEAN